MKQAGLLALGAYISTAIASNHMAHHHLHKRDVVTTTVWEDVTETVNVVVTVYGPPPGDASAAGTTSTATTPAQLPVNQDKAANVVAPPSITPSVTPPASVTPPSQAPAIAPAPVQQEQAAAPQVQAAAPKAQAAAPQAQAAAPKAQTPQQPAAGDASSGRSSGSSQPSGGSCGTTGGKCTAARLTIYNDQGLGACGWTNDTNTQDFIALAEGKFGTYSNDAPGPHKNAWCGRTATISFNGKQTSAVVTDKCPGCPDWSLDLSLSLWNKVTGGKPIGYETNVEWWFTEDAIYHGPGG